jgi:uncharacterized protein
LERSPLSSLYLDSSALTKLVIDEDHSSALAAAVLGRDLVSSRVAVVEVTKAVARNDPEADPEPMLGQLTLIDLDPDLARIAGATGGPGLRALDAIHVASALRVALELEAFVTYDARQAEAAEAAGLRVLTPTGGSPS